MGPKRERERERWPMGQTQFTHLSLEVANDELYKINYDVMKAGHSAETILSQSRVVVVDLCQMPTDISLSLSLTGVVNIIHYHM